MARAMTAGELADIREDNQYSILHLAVWDPPTIMTAESNGVPVSNDNVAQLTIKNSSFAAGYSSAPAGCIVYIGTSPGAYDKGMVRLREALSGAPTTLKFGEISDIEWLNNEYITVVDEITLAARHIRISGGTVYMDYDVAYSDQHEYPNPVPVLGPTLIPVWLDGDSVLVNFDAGDSWALDGGAITYSWAAPGAAITNDMTTATPEIWYDAAGSYRVSCTVTRDYGGGNTKTSTGYRFARVYASGSDDPIDEFELLSCSGSLSSGGWAFRVRMYAEAGSGVRDRAMVALWAEDWYGAEKGSIGPISDREQIVIFGWIAGESITWDAETSTVEFEVQSPAWWLRNIQGFPAGIEDVQTTPAAWTEFEDLDTRSGLWHFLYWRSTLWQLADFTVTDDTRGLSEFSAAQATLWAQIQGQAMAAIMAEPACDRFGRLFIDENLQILPSGDRGSIPTVIALTSADIRESVDLERVIVPPVGLVDLSGVAYSAGTGTPYFSLAPGHVPKAFGASIEGITSLALADQAGANALAELILAWRNNEYPSVSLPLAANNRMIDIVPAQRVTLSIAAADTPRGIVWSSKKLIARSVSYSHNPRSGQLLVDVGAEAETDNTDIVSQNGDTPSTPPSTDALSSPPPVWQPTPDDPTLGSGKVVGVAGYGGFAYTTDITAATPTWTTRNTGLGSSTVIYGLAQGAKTPTQALCIDGDGDLYYTANWRTTNWSASLTADDGGTSGTDLRALLATAESITYANCDNVEIVEVESFDVSGTQYWFAVVNYTDENLAAVVKNKTRVIRSSNGTSWTVGGEIPGRTYLSNDYDSYDISKFDASSDGRGLLLSDGTRLIIVAKTWRGSAGILAYSGVTISLDLGDTWANTPELGDSSSASGIGGGGYSGGNVYASYYRNSSDDYLVSTNDYGATVTEIKDVSALDFAKHRGAFAILANGARAELDIDSGNTRLYLNESLTGTITGDICRTVHGFRGDSDYVYVGRSWILGERASGGDENAIYLSTNGGSSFTDKTGALYTAGITGLCGIISDWTSD